MAIYECYYCSECTAYTSACYLLGDEDEPQKICSVCLRPYTKGEGMMIVFKRDLLPLTPIPYYLLKPPGGEWQSLAPSQFTWLMQQAAVYPRHYDGYIFFAYQPGDQHQ